MYLRVEHKNKNFKKTWKLESSHKTFSLGHSKQADLRLDASYPGITGVLQFNDNTWSFTHLNSPEPDSNNNSIERFIPINGPTVIPLKEGELCLTPYEKKVQLFNTMNSEEKSNHVIPKLWLVWRRNTKVWFSEFVALDSELRWPHNKKRISIKPTVEWQDIESDGIVLSYKQTVSPDINSFKTGAFKVLFDRSIRSYLVAALIACFITGSIPILFSKKIDLQADLAKSPSESTVIHLEQKKPQPPTPPKNAVAKALAQAAVPKSDSSPKPSSKKALGQVFSLIGKHSLKSIAVGSGPKTITITPTTQPVQTTATTFKALGSLGSGTGLHPSQFTKGLAKAGGVGLGQGGTIGGTNLGQISQGNVGQGDIGLLHKESEVSGGLDREVIAKYIQSQKGKILFCYERQLSANPGLFGKVSVKFQIAAGGDVETYNILETTLANESVESCLLHLISQWRFPKPAGGVKVLVSYPFVFKSLN